MAYHIVRANTEPERPPELAEKLRENAFITLRPFGQAVSYGLNNARWESASVAIWEEEDYCSPPLAMLFRGGILSSSPVAFSLSGRRPRKSTTRSTSTIIKIR